MGVKVALSFLNFKKDTMLQNYLLAQQSPNSNIYNYLPQNSTTNESGGIDFGVLLVLVIAGICLIIVLFKTK